MVDSFIMSEAIDELKAIASELTAFQESFDSSESFKLLERLKRAASDVAQSWSRSWLGYHSHVYYSDLATPPPGHHFSIEWGFDPALGETTGDWREFKAGVVEREVYRRAGDPDLSTAKRTSKTGKSLFLSKKETLVSILHALVSTSNEPYWQKLLEEANGVISITKNQFISAMMPKGKIMTRDTLAGTHGLQTPPHISVLGDVAEIQGPAIACQNLATVARKTFSHLERTQKRARGEARIGTNVFIGHGGSKIWRELKDFVNDRLHLPWDEFNRVPVAGNANIARLSDMLEAAAVALIVMTAEDEQRDGKVRARENVVHEAGLFQGRLGFTKAIILLEDGCEEFSNIKGLGHIRFPKGNISACFGEIRRVLEREGLIEEE
jgi:predicted nucleotide-binding protein